MPIEGAGNTAILCLLNITARNRRLLPLSLLGEQKELHVLGSTFTKDKVALYDLQIIFSCYGYIFHNNCLWVSLLIRDCTFYENHIQKGLFAVRFPLYEAQ